MNHTDREDLAGEHKYGDAGQFIILVVFLAVWALDNFVFHYTTFLNNYIPLPVQIISGIILVLAAFFLARAGMRIVFGKVRETPGVIREGVFKLMRHPIYFSEILFYLGLLFFRTSLSAAVVWVIAIVFLTCISRYEEKLLLSRYGEDYKAYMKDVGMFFPKFKRPRDK
jgi:protein-S-isoprenylcysteine O-methyltransferase Ste14